MYVNILIRISFHFPPSLLINHCGNFLPCHQHTWTHTDTNLCMYVHTHSYLVMRSHVILLDFMVIAIQMLKKIFVKWMNGLQAFNTRKGIYYYCCQKERSVNNCFSFTLPLLVGYSFSESVLLLRTEMPNKRCGRNGSSWIRIPFAIPALPLEENLGRRTLSQGIVHAE